MNEPRNNSLLSTIVFFCIAVIVMSVLVLQTEPPITSPVLPSDGVNQASHQ